MKELIICSANPHKIEEIKQILAPYPLKSLLDFDFPLQIEETGSSYLQNAQIKIHAVRKYLPDAYLLSDDSGLFVYALPDILGVHSARFAPEKTYRQKHFLINEMLKDDKRAKFICCLVLSTPSGENHFYGEVEGEIGLPSGKDGFGYDPIFYYQGVSFATLEQKQKNQISHRGKALQQLIEFLKEKKL